MQTPIAVLFAAIALATDDPQPSLVVQVQMPDYPADALAAKAEGKVPVVLHIEPDGQLRCSVTDKSAPALLRRPSCVLIAKRWPFGPERDSSGVAKPTDVALVVAWRIRDPRPASGSDFGGATPISPESWLRKGDYLLLAAKKRPPVQVRVAFKITEGGHLANCVPANDPTGHKLADIICPLIIERAALLPAMGSDGKPKASTGFLNVALLAK